MANTVPLKTAIQESTTEKFKLTQEQVYRRSLSEEERKGSISSIEKDLQDFIAAEFGRGSGNEDQARNLREDLDPDRLPWTLTTVARSSKLTGSKKQSGDTVPTANQATKSDIPEEYIAFNVNPERCSFAIKLRGELQKVKDGMVYHTWYNRKRKTYFDELELSLEFQSGNILPITFNEEGKYRHELPQGAEAFHKFYNLLDDPKILENGDTNYVILKYYSRLLPGVKFFGHFDPQSGAPFTDETSGNNEVKWTATLFVTHSIPELKDLDSFRGLANAMRIPIKYK